MGPPNFNDDGTVGATDLLALLINWGLCPCVEGTESPSLEDELDAHCLTMEHWYDFEYVMQTGSEAEKENYLCWMLHYLEECNRCFCTGQADCPDDDPFN